MYSFYKNNVIHTKNGINVCGNSPDGIDYKDIAGSDIAIKVYFSSQSASEIMLDFGHWWGGWNECPSAEEMSGVIKEWEDKFGIILTEVAHDRLTFECKRKPNEAEAEQLLTELKELPSNALNIGDYSDLKNRIIEEGIFSLWWINLKNVKEVRMFELVPSLYMRSLFEDLNFELSDFNKATIIWNMCGKTRDEIILALKELAESTKDDVLRNQIIQRIEYENKMLELIQNNDGKYVYVVLDEDYLYCGFFSDYEMAYRYGMNRAKGNEERPFQIEKQRIIKEDKDLIVKSPGRLNWNMFPESKEILTQEYEGNPVASVHYTSEGMIQKIWSNEMSEEDEDRVDSYRRERFEFQFINIPFEGTRGFQVKDIRDGSIGVLMQDTEDWRRYLSDISEKELYVDYSDVQVEVVFLTSQGLWSHEHINPIYLELERYYCEDEGDESRAKAKAMEFFSEYWIRKAKDCQKMDDYEKRVIESAREYRNICLDEQARQEKRKCGVVDRAKTIEELII